jgi:OmcA/MtrC family decaheme c-type cytochrome
LDSALLLLSSFLFDSPLVYGQGPSGDGLKAEILGVKIPDHRKPVVTFKISDAKGNPLDRSQLEDVRFTIAAIQAGERGETGYHNYVLSKVPGREYVYKGEGRKPVLPETSQPDYDRGGSFTRVKPGLFAYTFKTPLPANYDKKTTHVAGGELTRENRKYVANPLYEFVPAGGKVKLRRQLVETASCNNCHDPLKAHGGLRQEAGYCALCHTAQLTDPESGENLDFRVLVHRIHRGKNLPSVKGGKPFLVVGFRQSVFDFSTIGLPQDVRNCQTCHTKAPQAANWMNFPATAPCTSCHDHVDLKSGKNHPVGAMADGTCMGCHQPTGPEFGPSVSGAHAVPAKSAQLPGVVFDILKVEGGRPGENPAVTFSVKDKKGAPVDGSKMNNLSLFVAWPTTDYRVFVEEDGRKAQSIGSGVYTHRFKYAIPQDAKGSGALSIQGYSLVDLKKADGSVIKGVRDVGFNVVKYFAITDREAVPRRTVVRTQNCNACHETLALHGEMRRNTEFCVTCHNATQTDEVKRKTAKGPMPPTNVHFKMLIHKIHTGEELGEPLIVYGGPPVKPAPIDLSEVRFPGDRRNCVKCHEKGTYEIPLPPGVLATAIPQADGSVKNVPPITAACTSCHTKEAAKAHVETQTASGGRESCVVCHGKGREFSVQKAHRR